MRFSSSAKLPESSAKFSSASCQPGIAHEMATKTSPLEQCSIILHFCLKKRHSSRDSSADSGSEALYASIKKMAALLPLYCVTVGSNNSRAGNGKAMTSTRSSSSQPGSTIVQVSRSLTKSLCAVFEQLLVPTGSSTSEKTDCTSRIFPQPKLFSKSSGSLGRG